VLVAGRASRAHECAELIRGERVAQKSREVVGRERRARMGRELVVGVRPAWKGMEVVAGNDPRGRELDCRERPAREWDERRDRLKPTHEGGGNL